MSTDKPKIILRHEGLPNSRSLKTYVENGGYSALRKVLSMQPAQIIDEAKQQAREEADRIKLAAQAEIDQEVNRAREKLRTQVSALAVAGAEKILRSSVDMNAHRAMVDELAAEL